MTHLRNVDMIVSRTYVESLLDLLQKQEPIAQGEMADEIIEFVENMERKYKYGKDLGPTQSKKGGRWNWNEPKELTNPWPEGINIPNKYKNK